MPMPILIITDLEATCWTEEESAGKVSEIIEIGAVAVDGEGTRLAEFQTFCRPALHPVSDFCTQLTTIKPGDVAGAPHFHHAYRQFTEWAFGLGGEPILTSWGDYDRKQLLKSCQWYDIPIAFAQHLNLKKAFATLRKDKRLMPMNLALEAIGVPLVGTHHRGIDDVRNIAGILSWLRSTYGMEPILKRVRSIDPSELPPEAAVIEQFVRIRAMP